MSTTINKAIVALVMAGIGIGNAIFGWVPPTFLTEANVLIVVTALTPFFVWLVPNRKAA